ncbi:MAG: hypothetical protein JO344_01775 [Planctomycetaceae bacterium]|nr:hypothetical protein [Planctomycetaceae bacterium]
MSDLDMGNISDPGDADPSLGGDHEQVYRLPRWPGEFPDLRLSLRDATLFARLSVITLCQKWSADPFAGGAAWAAAAERWDAWAAAEPDEVRED